MNREQLIEKAAKAMQDAARERFGDIVIGERAEEMTREYARRALAVFEEAHVKPFATSPERVKIGADSSHVEEAHAPSDNERIANLDARQDAYRADRTVWAAEYEQDGRAVTDAFFRGWDAAAGFHGTVQGEPNDTCDEEVSRGGIIQPCEKVAVALHRDPEEHQPYPVCAYHARGEMVPLSEIMRTNRTIGSPDA